MTLTEAETRRKLIDTKLALAGWNVRDPSQVTEELDIDLAKAGVGVSEPTSKYSGHQFADYALLLHGKPVAVVEAKKASKSAELGKEQALQYAKNLRNIHGGDLPIIMYTNGHHTHIWEYGFCPPRHVHGFPTKNDLEWMIQRRKTRGPLSVELINTDIAGRPYQIAAIRSILERIEAKRRKFLLVMATGTGKTRVSTALIDVLLRAHWAKRVLFLVDRIALRDQAIDAFKEHLPTEPLWPKRKGNTVEKNFARDRRIYVTTYPTMLNVIEKGTKPRDWVSPHFFDVIIADESHRSIYNVYKSVMDYFNCLTIGLTATPKDHIDHDTFKLFECDVHDPTYAYSYDEAVKNDPPYLCDFEVLKVRSKFQLEGIKGGTLPPAIQKKLIAEGKDIEDIDFEGSDLERKVTNAGTNALVVREFMEECIKDPTGTLPGKTIVFAITKAHARRIQTLFDKMYPEHAGKLARVLVSEDSRVYGKGGLLDQFKNNPFPRVAISVDLLDTGVDVREITNLVFAKPVYSYTKFWQMIGRGTRILDDDPHKRKPWCPDKDKFLIIDCWGNFDFFKMKPKGKEPNQQVPMPVKLFHARLDQLEAAIAKGETDIVKRVKQTLRDDLDSLPKNNVIVSDQSAEIAKIKPQQFWHQLCADGIAYLRQTIAPVLRARSGIDMKAMRFETDLVCLSEATLNESKETIEAIKESIIEQVSELPLNVNLVRKEETLIQSVMQPSWWTNMADSKVVGLIERLGPLMRLRERKTTAMMELNLEDLLISKEYVEFGPENERISTNAYRDRVEAYIQNMVDENPVLTRLKAGEDVSEDDIHALAELLRGEDPYITEELLRKVYDHKAARFIQFLKHILGLEPLQDWAETVALAFDRFIAEHNTFSQLQIQFILTLKTFILQNGKVERKDLIAAPFTQIHPDGIRGVFGGNEIAEILSFAEKLVA
jgi:type I restriction enzyme, R subunit